MLWMLSASNFFFFWDYTPLLAHNEKVPAIIRGEKGAIWHRRDRRSCWRQVCQIRGLSLGVNTLLPRWQKIIHFCEGNK